MGELERIVRTLAALERWDYDYQCCFLCDGDVIPRANFEGDTDGEHDPGCPYAAAVRWVAEHPESP